MTEVSGLVHYQTADGVATITLDSPANRNALSADLMVSLSGHLDRALADDAVRVLVLSHTGRVFCSGMDLAASRGREAATMPVTAFPAILQTILDAPKPVVARVAGPARAGGIGLMAACDLAVAARSATFAFTEVRLGLVPAVISVVVRARMQPTSARELFLTGEVFDATQAEADGLVTRAVNDDVLDAEVDRFVDLLARGAPVALAATKELLGREAPAPTSEAFTEMTTLSGRHFASEEGQEGIAAFGEKRPPRWVPEGRSG